MKPMLVRSPFVQETDPKILLKYDTEANGWMFLSSVELDYEIDGALEAGKLQRRLKEATLQLCEDDNGIIMRLGPKVE